MNVLDKHRESLKSASHQDRVAGLEALRQDAEQERDKTIATLERQIKAAKRVASESIGAGQAALARRRAELHAELAPVVAAALHPLAATFSTDQRGTASALILAWRSLQTRCREQLGAELGCHHLALAFAAAAGRLSEVGRRGWMVAAQGDAGSPADVAAAAAKALETGNPVVAHKALAELELVVAQRRPHAPDDERTAALQSGVTMRDADKAIESVDATREGYVRGNPVGPDLPREPDGPRVQDFVAQQSRLRRGLRAEPGPYQAPEALPYPEAG